VGTNILIIGNGGREHALAWKLVQSPRIGKLFVAPGNGGTRHIAENIAIDATDIDGLVRFAANNNIGLTAVGPEEPLAGGVVEAFHARGLRIFGPTRAAAEIESSKAFAKNLMSEAAVPTATFQVFSEYGKALAHVREHGAPLVVKANGLAFGKGVYVCKNLAQAEAALAKIMRDRIHKDAGNEVVIEEFLDGQEISIHAFCDGKTFVLFPPAQDHKPVHDGDEGENTGGMGTIAPVSWVSADTLSIIGKRIIRPTLERLAEIGRPFPDSYIPASR
jgi:phosphoribosylamine--glycine ligase